MSGVLTEQLARWRSDRMAFRREAVTLEDGTPFGTVMEDWQREDFAALDRFRHAYLERPRGHSKTFDVAAEATTQLMLGPAGQRLYCAAADEDQARLLFEDVAGMFRRSALLRGSVEITRREIAVTATGSRLRVLSSDVPSAYGLRPDMVIVDELAEWASRGLWDSLWTATGKRAHCRVVAITTAGWDRTSIAWEVRQMAEREADWYFSSRGQCASWISPAWLEQQARSLPPHTYRRLHENVWVEGVGAFLTAEEVDAIFEGHPPRGPGAVAVGVDLGATRDAAVVAVVRRHYATDTLAVERLATWAPGSGARVDLTEVQEEVAAAARLYSAQVVLDPWQAILMGQQLEAEGIAVHEVAFTATTRREIFGTLLDLVKSGRLRAEPHETFRRELLLLEVQEGAAGWRVDHRPGRHDDHVVAVALACYGLLHGDPAPMVIGWDRSGVSFVDEHGRLVRSRGSRGWRSR